MYETKIKGWEQMKKKKKKKNLWLMSYHTTMQNHINSQINNLMFSNHTLNELDEHSLPYFLKMIFFPILWLRLGFH